MAHSVRHEFDWHGAHRIVVGGTASEWMRYEDPAIVDFPDEGLRYTGFTDYFGERVEVGQIPQPVRVGDVVIQTVCRECELPYEVDEHAEKIIFGGCEHIQEKVGKADEWRHHEG